MARWKKRTESDEKVGYEFKNGEKEMGLRASTIVLGRWRDLMNGYLCNI